MKKSASKFVGENKQFPLTSEEINLIAELGFMAATNGFVVPAIRIFQGLLVLRSDHSFPYIGLAVARLYAGAFNDAVRVLREDAAPVRRDREEIELYLGLALHLAGQPIEAARVLYALFDHGELDTNQRLLAESVLLQIKGGIPQSAWPSPARVVDLQALAGINS